MSFCYYAKWRIALDEPGLEFGSFFVHRMIPPATCEYRGYSTESPNTDGSTDTHGYGVAEMVWGELSKPQYATLYQIVEQARQARQRLFMTIDAGDGVSFGEQFIDISGYPGAIKQRQGGPLHLKLDGAHYQGVALTLRNVEELNRPSGYS